MPVLSDGTTIYTDRDLRGRLLGVDTYEAQREAFDAALVDLFAAMYYTPTWGEVREAYFEAEGDGGSGEGSGRFAAVEVYAEASDLFGSGFSDRGYVARHNRQLLVRSLRKLFRDVLTRRPATDGRFLWCHVEEAFPPLADRVMESADHGSAFIVRKH